MMGLICLSKFQNNDFDVFDRNFKHVFEVFDIRINDWFDVFDRRVNDGLMCLQDSIMG